MISISALKYDMTNSSNSITAFKQLFFCFFFFLYVLILIDDEASNYTILLNVFVVFNTNLIDNLTHRLCQNVF